MSTVRYLSLLSYPPLYHHHHHLKKKKNYVTKISFDFLDLAKILIEMAD